MQKSVRAILSEVAELPCSVDELPVDADLFRAGLKSLAVVRVMVALEREYSVEFRGDMLGRQTFSTIGAIERAVASLRAPQAFGGAVS